jgi:uncharacterized protein (TIRG00374 family)
MSFAKRNIFLFLFSLLVGVVIFVWLGRVIDWQKIWASFDVFKGWQGVVIVFLTFIITLVGNWRWYEILKDNQIKIDFWKLWRTYLGGYSLMYFFPIIFLSGEIFRVLNLSAEEKVPVSKAAASVVIERVLEWTVNLVVILFGVLFFAYKLAILPAQILYVFGAFFIGFLVMLTYFYFKALRQKSIISGLVEKFGGKHFSEENRIVEIEHEVLKFFQPGHGSMRKGILLSLLRAIVMLVRVWILILFLTSINIGFVAALSVLGFSYFSSLVPIPTSLGSHEVIQSAGFSALGLEISIATAFTMIIRAAEIILSLLGLAFLVKKGFNIMEERLNIINVNEK